MTSPAQLTTIFPNEVLARVERLRLNAFRRFTNRMRGEHLSRKGGTSTEFADFRDYVPGDDIRYVDWNIFSRLRRPYLKVFYQEEEMHVVLLVDASASMGFEGKLERARQLAATFGVLGLRGNEKVSAYAFNAASGAELPRMPPSRGRGKMRELFRFLEAIEPGGDAPVEQGIESMLYRHRGRGVAVVCSDFLTFDRYAAGQGPPRDSLPGSSTPLLRAFNLLFNAGLEVFALQVLGPSELRPELNGDVRLVDAETAETLDVSSAGDLAGLYEEHLLSWQREIAALCRRRSGRSMLVDSQEPLEGLLFDRMLRQGWLR